MLKQSFLFLFIQLAVAVQGSIIQKNNIYKSVYELSEVCPSLLLPFSSGFEPSRSSLVYKFNRNLENSLERIKPSFKATCQGVSQPILRLLDGLCLFRYCYTWLMLNNIVQYEQCGLRQCYIIVELSFPNRLDNGPLTFRRNFEKIRNRQKYYHILKEHPKLSKIAKFGCEMF